MRIQHNIMAMSAYRNYTNNVSAMKKNLEKLSSGYKINRAGDDAAGLAISEKMRAQITGLETAQKNAKDGISLVQTAEGALTEVHDMLNRMVELASQSANGTYDNDTDRAQMQKEIEQLKSEIDRIADSSNFNGINLLDGSMAITDAVEASSTTTTNTYNGMDRILTDVIAKGEKAYEVAGKKSILDGDGAAATKGEFEIDLSTLNFTVTGPTSATNVQFQFTLNVGGTDITATATGISGTATTAAIATAVRDAIIAAFGSTGTVATSVTINGVKWAVAAGTAATTGLKFTQVDVPKTTEEAQTNFDASVTIDNKDSGTIKITPVGASDAASNEVVMGSSIKVGTQVIKQGVALEAANTANTVFNITEDDLHDGTQIAIGTATIILRKGGSESAYATYAVSTAQTLTFGTQSFAGRLLCVDIKDGDSLDSVLQKISMALGGTVNFITKGHLGAASTGSAGLVETSFQIGVSDTSKGYPSGLAVQRATAYTATATDAKYDSLDKLAANFKMQVTKTTTTEAKEAGKGLTLQIGDTADGFNQLNISINDMHATAMGIGDISIANQESAAKAVDAIKAAINYVSDVRGTLGATQNRLDHTINNLAVMTENIQDAESTIRDVDVAEEMMAYTKNNILIQSAQAMLAQANQVPQGVLQLLQ